MPNEPLSAELLQSFRDGSESAATALFDRYVDRLTRLARMRLATKLQQRIDPEDVVLSAYRSFFVAVRNDRFSVGHSGDLWRLLARMTLHKLYRSAVHHTAEMRSVDREQKPPADAESANEISQRDPSPDEAVAFADELETLMRRLNSTSRRVLELRLQGYRIREIADEIDCNERTVRRAMETIREEIGRAGNFEVPVFADESTPVSNAVTINRDELAKHAARLFERIGELDFSEFTLQEHIGTGASGRVYRSRNQTTGDTVAIKFLRKDILANTPLVRRFIDEADIVTQLDHPAIVRVHGIGRTPIGGFFIVQDWVDGSSLAERGRVDWQPATAWIAAAADGLQHAHEQGVIHCDLKPGNLLLGNDGRIRVTDFGFAQRIDSQIPRATVAGTLGFMASEQIEPACGPIGPATDVYGLGAVLFTLLTGHPPITGNNVAEILTNTIAGNAHTSLKDCEPSLPESVCKIVDGCLHRNPAKRLPTAKALATALRC